MILTEIGGSCYKKIIIKKITQILKHKLSKKAQEKDHKINGIYRIPIGIGIIGSYRYIGTCLIGLMQKVKK